MPARNRCLCQSRPVIWLTGLFIQFKRARLALRRGVAAMKRAVVRLGFLLAAAFRWLAAFPAKAIHWIWTSLFWPVEHTEPEPPPPIESLQNLTETPPTGPSWWERTYVLLSGAWCTLKRFARGSQIQIGRAGLRARTAFQEHTAWTFATVTGSLGILLMLVLQLTYSFQTLNAKAAPAPGPQFHTAAKTRIDPGFPQTRQMELSDAEIAQIDPFAPAQSDPTTAPRQTLPPAEPIPPGTFPEPLNDLPPLEPVPAEPARQHPREPEPFIDTLDMLPLQTRPQSNPEPLPAREPVGNPFSPIPSLPMEPEPLREPKPAVPPMEDPSFNPIAEDPQVPAGSIPEVTPIQPQPRQEAEPFIDPLDMLPPLSPTPQQEMPQQEPEPPHQPQEFNPEATPAAPVEKPPQAEPDPFLDPLDMLPLSDSPPTEQTPKPPREPLPEADPIPHVPSVPEEPFIDPLDAMPFKPPPQEAPAELPREFVPEGLPMPPANAPPKVEADPFIDPLDMLPPMNPQPRELQPANPPLQESPATGEPMTPVDLGIGFLRLPVDDGERFLLQSGSEYLRQNISPEMQYDAWDRYLEHNRGGVRPLRPYWERVSAEERRRLEQDLITAPPQSDYEPNHQLPYGDLSLGIQKNLPRRSTAHEPLKYEIVVENRGQEMIESVDVDEAVPPTHQLTDVTPAGHFENNLLRWRLRDIKPGEQRRLSVEVVPSKTGAIETMTSVRPSTRVATVTDVSNPPLRLRRSGYRTIAVDEPVLFTNHVQNLSKTTQREVVVVEQVPVGYRVVQVEDEGVFDQQTGTITWKLAALPAGETAKLGVRLLAESTGELLSRVKGSTDAGPALPIRARVYVDRVQTERVPSPPERPASRGLSPRRCSNCNCCRCTPCCCK